MPDTDKMNSSKKKPPLRLHINPVADSFQMTGLEGKALIIVSDLNCRVLLKQEISGEENVSMSILRKGIYIVKVTSGTVTVKRKLEKK